MRPEKYEMTNAPQSTDTVGHNIERDSQGQACSATHASITEPDARLFRKGKSKSAQSCFMGHALMENRNGFAVEAEMTHADACGESTAALHRWR